MSEFIKPYNDDPFVGNLSTPVTTSTATKLYLGNLPIYRKGLSPVLRGLEIGMAHFLLSSAHWLEEQGALLDADCSFIHALIYPSPVRCENG